MRYITIFILLLCLTKVSAQDDQLLTPEQLKADADYYFKTLHTNHPNPYYYYSLNEFEDKKNKIYAQLNKPLTHEQFAWIIGEMNSCLDMHSLIQIYFLTHWRKNYFTDQNLLFFPNVRFEKEKVYLKKNNIEIEEINGIKINTIIQDLAKYFNWKLPYERNIASLEACFSNFLMNKYNFRAPFKVKFYSSDIVQTLDGYTLNDFMKEFPGGYLGGLHDYHYKIYPLSSIAIFNIISFEINRRDHLKKKLNDFFKEVDNLNIQNVFYDLTMNEGGDYSVLCKEGVEALNIIEHDSIYLNLNKIERIGQINKKYKVKKALSYPNKSLNFSSPKRKLFILQGINTKSGGDYFCRIVAENKLGTLVGQNTGEPTVAFSSSPFHIMPNSKIQFSVATTLWDYSDYFKEETLHPDVYWDVNHCREFTKEELIEIVEYCKSIEQQTN